MKEKVQTDDLILQVRSFILNSSVEEEECNKLLKKGFQIKEIKYFPCGERLMAVIEYYKKC